MKLFKSFLAIFLIAYTPNIFSQNVIAVEGNGNTQIYPDLTTAIANAAFGDTLYLSGGIYVSDTFRIDKTIHVYGVGHHPDSMEVTGETFLNAHVLLLPAASGGSIQGLRMKNITFGNSVSNHDVDDFTVKRCKAGTLYLGKSGTTNSSDNIFIESAFGAVLGYFSTNNEFYNNVITRVQELGTGNMFRNNIFLNNLPLGGGGNVTLEDIDGSTFDNNVFRSRATNNQNTTNCEFNNNLVVGNLSANGGTILNNNIENQGQAGLFVNGNASSFSYAHDYHLPAGSQGIGLGTDGTNVGIFGGLFPWKESTHPDSPRIISVQIAPNTDTNGNLQLNIQVKAQHN